MKIKKLATMAVLSALSVVLVALVHFPIFPAVSFLEYDPADVPVLIGTFAFGPWAGLAMTVVVSLVQGLTVSAQSGVYGILMHIIATGALCVSAGLIYARKKTKKRAVIALCAGTAMMTLVMGAANLVVTPHFTGMSVGAILDLLFVYILPFNFIKAGVNSLLTFFVYKSVSRHLPK